MTETGKRRLRIIRRIAVIAILGGIVFGYALAGGRAIGALRGAVTAATVMGLIVAFELGFIERPRGARFRRLPFLPLLAARTLVYLALILLGQEITALLVPTNGIAGLMFDRELLWGTLYSLFCAAAANFVLQVNRILGQGELLKFVLGRYHRPRQEERIFLFLDLVGSTALAERLGGVRFFDLLNQIYRDIAEPILEHGGEIHKYVGDEVIVTWTSKSGLIGSRCLACALAIEARLAGLAERYQMNFGVAPAFRYGLHLGLVMSGELGSVKQEIAYVGDPVNTAARLIDVCRDTGRSYVASGALLDRVPLPRTMAAVPLGPIHLRGKEAALPLFALGAAPAVA